MSKKKVTMTLKDFHGGYIHSDLPLPSAPGQPSKLADGIDRKTSYGNSMGKSDNRLRPASAGSSRNLDDENPLFNYNLRIGRNFDEDERKPLHGVSGPRRTSLEESIPSAEPKADNITPFIGHGLRVGQIFDEDDRRPLNGNSGPRRTVSDESIHVHDQNSYVGHISNFHRILDEDEIKPSYGVSGPHRRVGDETIGTRPSQLVKPTIDNTSGVRVGSKNSQLPVSQSSSSSIRASYAGRVGEMHSSGPSSQNLGGGRGFLSSLPKVGGGNEPHPNVWGLGKEIRSVQESISASSDPAMKLAQASALEKVSTGRWTSRQHMPSLKNSEVIAEAQTEVGPDYKVENNVEIKEVGHMMQSDVNVPVNVWSNGRSTVTVNENHPVDELSHLLQTVSMDRFVAQPISTIASQSPSATMPQAGSSYFGGPNSFWSNEPVSIAWSSQDIMVDVPPSVSFEKVSYDRWNSQGQTTTEFDYRTNKTNMSGASTKILTDGPDAINDSDYHDLYDMMHIKAGLSATDKINSDSQKEIWTYERPQSNIQALPSHMTGLKQGYVFGPRVGNKSQLTPVSQISSAEKPVEVHSIGFDKQFSSDVNRSLGHSNAIGTIGRAVVAPYTNPQNENEAVNSIKKPVSVSWSSTGRSAIYAPNRLDLSEESKFHNSNPTMNVERGVSVDHITDGGVEKEMPTQERVSSFERKTPTIQSTGISSTAETLPSESLVRPKLKLLPRSKPLEESKPHVGLKQGLGQPKDNSIHGDSEFARKEVEALDAQQAKLNLKPHLQPLEQHKTSGDVYREKTVFGLARPREVVLKERDGKGVHMDIYKSQLPSRAHEIPRKDDSFKSGTSPRYSEKSENTLSSQRTTSSKYTNDRHDNNKLDSSRTDAQRRNFRQNEPRKNYKEVDQWHRQKRQERPSSPETWRKPVDQTKLPLSSTEDHHQPSPRFGKAASAVELAQTFSKSVCDPSLSGGSRSISNGVQIPFSRLVGPPRMLQTNGY